MSTLPLPPIFRKRCRRTDDGDFRRRIWTTKDGLVRVVWSHCLLGNGAIPDRWLVVQVYADNERLVSRHRKASAAFHAAMKVHADLT